MANYIVLSGRLTKENELLKTTSGKSFVHNTLAVYRGVFNDEEITDFIYIVAWNKTAEALADRTHKGDKIFVTGRLQSRDYEKDGEKKVVWEVLVDRVEFMQTPQNKPTRAEKEPYMAHDKGGAVRFEDVPTDIDPDLPF